MPVHDWTRVDAGLFHAFHQRWISALCDALNAGGLPRGYFALPEQTIRGSIPDVLALKLSPQPEEPGLELAALAVATVPPAPGTSNGTKSTSMRKKPTASRFAIATATSSP